MFRDVTLKYSSLKVNEHLDKSDCEYVLLETMEYVLLKTMDAMHCDVYMQQNHVLMYAM